MKHNKIYQTIIMLILALTLTAMPASTAEAASNKPAKVTIKSASRNSSKTKITIKWKSVKKATGYQLAYKKSSAKSYTIKTLKKTTSKTINASKTATYQVKVRAYRKTKGKTYYGKWSSVKKINAVKSNTTTSKSDKTTTESDSNSNTTTIPKHEHTYTIPVYKTVTDRKAYDEKIPTGEFNITTEEHYFSQILSKGNNTNLGLLVTTGMLNTYNNFTNSNADDFLDFPDFYGAKNSISNGLSAGFTNSLIIPNYNDPVYKTIHHEASTHQEVWYYQCSYKNCKKKIKAEVKDTCSHNYKPVYTTVIDMPAYEERVWYNDPFMSFWDIPWHRFTHVYSYGVNWECMIDITDMSDSEVNDYLRKLERNMYGNETNTLTAACITDPDNNKKWSGTYEARMQDPTYVHHDEVSHQELVYYKCSNCGREKDK